MATVRVNKRRKTSSHSWLESTNPLWGLSIAEARLIYDAARRGNYARLQYLYDQVERADPVLLTCVERRASALASLGWHVVKARGAEDSPIVEKQLNAVESLLDGIDNLSEAIEHLSLAFFRGYSHCQPEWNAKGYVEHINKLNSWNFSRNVTTGAWHWNENADSVLEVADLPEIPSDELITVERPRAIDYPALSIYLRHNLAESDWGRFLERYGIPPVTITMPDNVPPGEVQAFQEAAVAIAEARSGALPAGSLVSYGSESRGTDPFSAFIQHQEKLIVLLATGGTLTSLAESGSGTLAGSAQMEVWQQIVARDAEIIGDAIHRAIVIPFLGMHFPGEKIAVKFELGHEEEQSASDIFDLAAKAKAAGYVVEKGQLEERTGFILEKDAAMGGFGMLNSQEDTREAVANPLQNDFSEQDDKILANSEKTLQRAILGFSQDMQGTAKSLHDLLAADDEEFLAKAKAMAEASPEELGFKADGLAAEIEADIAQEVADTLGEKSVKNSEQDIQNAGTSEGAKKGWETRRKNGWSKEQVETNRKAILSLFEDATDKKESHPNRTVELGTISKEDAEEIAKLNIPGYSDLSGVKETISLSSLKHSINYHHGDKEKTAGNKPLGKEDVRKMVDVYSNYDKIEVGSKDATTGKSTIRRIKKFKDGTVYVCESLLENNYGEKSLEFKTMWKKKK